MNPNKTTSSPVGSQSKQLNTIFVVAWFICTIFYFVQYALRSAPSIMQTEIIATLGITKVEMAGIIGLYFYSYAFFALVSGVLLDRIGPRFTASSGIVLVVIGCVLFGTGTVLTAQTGRFLQGAGSGLAFTSAVFLATRGFPKKWLATAVGMTQCFGMLGGFMGQAVVSPIIKNEVVSWQMFWMIAAGVLAVVFFGSVLITPRTREGKINLGGLTHPYLVVLKNPQSYICAIISAMMFMPTNVGNIAWGSQFLVDGLHVNQDDVALRLAMVPLGWVIGCPILGYLSDMIGRRKPVVLASIIAMLVAGGVIVYMPNVMPNYVMGLLLGVASGAAMIPYTMIKEVNPDEVKGTATGVINFIVFVISAIMTNLFSILIKHLTEAEGQLNLQVFQSADLVFVGGLVVAFILALCVRETGAKVNGNS